MSKRKKKKPSSAVNVAVESVSSINLLSLWQRDFDRLHSITYKQENGRVEVEMVMYHRTEGYNFAKNVVKYVMVGVVIIAAVWLFVRLRQTVVGGVSVGEKAPVAVSVSIGREGSSNE